MADNEDDEAVRVWLVERDYDDRDLITLVYATPDGELVLRKEQAAATMDRASAVTAAREVDSDRLEPVSDTEARERYAAEVERVRDRFEPDETL